VRRVAGALVFEALGHVAHLAALELVLQSIEEK
jgi:hypothetical protein